jgi:hypothetical protein
VKWAFGIVLVLVVGAVAAFAIWTFRDDEASSSDDAALARAYAGVIAQDTGKVTIESVGRVSGDVWKVRAKGQVTGTVSCLLIDLSRFRRLGNDDYEGIIVQAMPCGMLEP